MYLNVCECMNDTDDNFKIIVNNSNSNCDMYKYLYNNDVNCIYQPTRLSNISETCREIDCSFYDFDSIITYNHMGGRPRVEVKIYDKMASCMLDTGPKISVIEYDIITTINPEVRCAKGSQVKVKGKAKLKITIGNHCKMIEFQVAEDVIPKLIGE